MASGSSKKESDTSQIFQFEITLLNEEPRIWRRVLVPADYNFRQMHLVIQDAMGWKLSHTHQFYLTDPATDTRRTLGRPLEGLEDYYKIEDETKVKISEHFKRPKDYAMYEYDMGDSWGHSIVLEDIIPAKPRAKYPKCVAGERACPPEDCGMYGYDNLIKVLSDPNHEEHDDMVEWVTEAVGGEFNPERFDPKAVSFVNLNFPW